MRTVVSLQVEDGELAGCTPLHCAVMEGYAAVVSLLLARGADATAIAVSGPHCRRGECVGTGHLVHQRHSDAW
jgi:hypothetical protein